MQHPEKSCSQCRARKIKCDLGLPRCSSCLMRNSVCQFGLRRKPGPPKGFKKQACSRKDSHGSSRTPGVLSNSSDENHVPLPNMRKRDYSIIMDETAPEAAIPFDVLQTLEDQLIDAYSAMNLFPFLPHVRKQHLLEPEVHGTLRFALVNAICAISAHSASNAIFEPLPLTRIEAAEMFATRAKSAYLRYTREEDHPSTLAIIKVAAILAFYQMNCSPGIKGWSMVGEAVRLSYDMRLDQLDSKNHLTSVFMSPEAAEDARYVWWSIYALDVYASSTVMRPFAITNNDINTALVSTHESQFKMGNVNPTQGLFLPSDLVELQMTALSLDHCDPLSTQTLCLLILSFGRSIANMRREQLDGRDVDVRSTLMQNTLATLRLSIPDDFLELHGGFDDMHIGLTRIELVLLLELQTLCLYSYPSSKHLLQEPSLTKFVADPPGQADFPDYFDEDPIVSLHNSEWDTCMQSALTVVRIVRRLSSEHFSRISPAMASVFWLPALTLVLHHRSRTTAAERATTASGAEVLKAALGKMGNTWVVARHFHDALAALSAGPANASTELHVQYILQSYTSPLVSVSCGRNNVHIPSLMIPFFNQSHDSQPWTLIGEY